MQSCITPYTIVITIFQLPVHFAGPSCPSVVTVVVVAVAVVVVTVVAAVVVVVTAAASVADPACADAFSWQHHTHTRCLVAALVWG